MRAELASHELETIAGIRVARRRVPWLLVVFCLAVIGLTTWYVITFREASEATFRPSPVATGRFG